MDGRHPARSLCGPGRAGDLSPGLELLRYLLAVFGGRAEVTSWAEVRRNGAIRAKEYPSVALTAPSWFVFPQPLMERTSSWPHFAIVVVASGPKPPLDALIVALNRVVNLVELFG
jgi:hypothetical protein